MSHNKLFSKILVANRGEIAVRIMRTCRELGIRTVAVFSDIDRNALHVQYADEAYNIGGNSAAESYLRGDAIVEVARKSGAEAVHPGYGFLAENPAFCELVCLNDLVFIGPAARAIQDMGHKTKARKLMIEAGVPVIPGTTQPLPTDPQQALHIAEEIGFPLMIKAAAGGGGKGMRVVSGRDDFGSAFRSAQSEALSSFGDNSVYLEKYVSSPHHIEIQVLADTHGSAVYLFERECSIQRRHQKVIEESPSVFIDPEMRKKMGETAVAAAQAVDYCNAGTVEFIVDQDRNFYFLEMNTRLQVEHPITELVTGKDLVLLQIMIAAGQPLPFEQADLSLGGAAIECRIYAEDPDNNFVPSPGKILHYAAPGGPGIRDDSGVYNGYEIPIYYDPLISKLCVWAETRERAIARMKRALSEYRISGVKTNIRLHKTVLDHQVFQKGIYDTSFLDKYWTGTDNRGPGSQDDLMLAIAAATFYQNMNKSNGPSHTPHSDSPAISSRWKEYGRQRFLSSRL